MSPEFWLQAGFWGILTAAFLGGSILPLSSEIVVLTAAATGYPWGYILVSASIGNSLAVILNYGLGWKGSDWSTRFFNTKPQTLEWLKKSGWPVLFLSFLPIIGDPITLAAGLVRFSFLPFLCIALPLRLARYIALLGPWMF